MQNGMMIKMHIIISLIQHHYRRKGLLEDLASIIRQESEVKTFRKEGL